MEAIQPIKALQPNVYQCGNTVYINCKFEITENKQPQRIDPTEVTINILNYKYELVEIIPAEEITREDVGAYSYDYTSPMEETVIIYEWVGRFEGEVFTKRGAFRTVFLDN